MKYHIKHIASSEKKTLVELSKVFLLFWILVTFNQVVAQNIKTTYDKTPLSVILEDFKNQYQLQLSFNHNAASQCVISDSSDYANLDSTLTSLLKKCRMSYEKSDGVYVIFPIPSGSHVATKDSSRNKIKAIKYSYNGQLVDAESNEPLPYTYIKLNNANLLADANGNFTYQSKEQQINVKGYHLGYFELDTTIFPGHHQVISLRPAPIALKEVVILDQNTIYEAHTGEDPGVLKVNHKATNILPGNNNNILFNLLHLHSGILASAEQYGDFSIWGSYRGQNMITFEEIPLFNTTALNREVGVINPLIVKDVEVYKGGYQVDRGDRVGGIIRITGMNGSKQNFRGTANLNSETFNAHINIPIRKKIAMQFAFRQSYYNLFDWNSIFPNSNNEQLTAYVPQNTFRDVNIKLSHNDKGHTVNANFIAGGDFSTFSITDERRLRNRSWENEVSRNNYGSSIVYSRNWKKAGITKSSISYSTLNTTTFDQTNAFRIRNDTFSTLTANRANRLSEFSLKTEHLFPSNRHYSLKMGINYVNNISTFSQTSNDISRGGAIQRSNRLSYLVKATWQLESFLQLKPGIKFDVANNIGKLFIQPRLNATAQILPHLKLKGAWGLYQQYISEIPLFDEFGNVFYFWRITDGNLLPNLRSEHQILGLLYQIRGLEINVEAYRKLSDKMARISYDQNSERIQRRFGSSIIRGIDFYAKKNLRKHEIWISYTFGKVEEDFNQQEEKLRLARQDQRHEVKGVAMFNFEPWYFSISHIFGSGLAYTAQINDGNTIPYSRTDMAILYHIVKQKLDINTGLSILNLSNRDNIGLSGTSFIPNSQRAYSKGIPLTPSLFVKIVF